MKTQGVTRHILEKMLRYHIHLCDKQFRVIQCCKVRYDGSVDGEKMMINRAYVICLDGVSLFPLVDVLAEEKNSKIVNIQSDLDGGGLKDIHISVYTGQVLFLH